MAGTRGLSQFKGKQLNDKIMRNRHFDSANKISENYIEIDWNSHRETLVDTKVDVFVQSNGHDVSGVNSLELASLAGSPVAVDNNTEGVVLGERVELRQTGTEDFPFIDVDGDRVYGRVRHDETDPLNPKFVLDFFSMADDGTGTGTEVETPYTFGTGSSVDFRYIKRTNLSVIPVDALVNGGSGFVEGATDANAYMNLNQLMVDLYGASGTLDNDGNANLSTSIIKQIADEITARTEADQAILDNYASTEVGKGASLLGVVLDTEGNYVASDVQGVLTELAERLAYQEANGGAEVEDARTRDLESANGYFKVGDFGTLENRLVDAETSTDTALHDFETRVTKLETEDEEEVYEAVGGETSYMLVNGVAKPKTVLMFINGQAQAPGINFDYIYDTNGQIAGFDFAPDVLEVHEGRPDVVFVKYKKIL